MSSSSSAALLVLSMLVAGYIPATHCYYFKYRTAREAGHRLYLTSASIGFASFLISEIILFSILRFFSFFSWLPQLSEKLTEHHIIILIVFSFVLSVLVTWGYNNQPDSKNKNMQRVWQKDDFSMLLSHATQQLKPISVTLENRKTYVGYVARTNEPDKETSHITLLPIFSGYRDEETLHLRLTNKYKVVFSHYLSSDNDTDPEDFYIVIPVNRIISSNIFSEKVYKKISKAF
ncbi:hypothetical protein [Alcanivorax sp.]|uniref:hypothetical protein n=1 Tax=Alcanivorax sp. TaxID=1872427 RepID=UPI0025BE0473|nr:hypothetical protein [Alcanivorax sp.]